MTPPRFALACVFIVAACDKTPKPADVATPPIHALPGATGPVTLDLFAYDRARDQIWIPVGETGSVDVFSIETGTFRSTGGFKTMEREAHGKKRMMGPSAVAIGDGFAYVSDRASNEVCAVNATTLALGTCVSLASPPDVIGYVAAAKEIWVTTPKQQSIAVLDASQPDAPKPKLVIQVDGSPECWAVDAARGIFYTNLEDKNRTLAIDVATHTVKSAWTLGCKEDGPRGVAVDGTRSFVFVACTDSVEILDAAHDGARLGTFDTGAGVDAIDFSDATKRLYVAAGKAARLTIAELSPAGVPSIVQTTTTVVGARNAVVDSRGRAYMVDPQTARLLTYP